ncbi:MAG: protein phosphatase 2C domain-containing protein [Candidatus Komeilibacteria bacterium]
MNSLLEICGGSVAGRDHVAAGRNNQDAYGWQLTDNSLIAVVCDGCSGGKHSEVGAQLGCQLILQTASRNYRLWLQSRAADTGSEVQLTSDWWESLRLDVLTEIRRLADLLGNSLTTTINDYFLFTVVGALITPNYCYLFSLGDGLYSVNDRVVPLRLGQGNTPPYLAYGLLDSSLHRQQPESLQFVVETLPRNEVNSLLLGSDGVSDLLACETETLPGKTDLVGPLSQFWSDDSYFRNRDLVRRRLSLINREHLQLDRNKADFVRQAGHLPDDTTLIAIRNRTQEVN